jgi:hypothetical protein
MVRKIALAATFGLTVLTSLPAMASQHRIAVRVDPNCPVPHDVAPLWQVGWPSATAWRYPCHRLMRDFAPLTCWHTFRMVTEFGVEWHREYICK